MSVSSIKDRFFLCLLNTKKIEIYNYDNNGKIDINKRQISEINEGNPTFSFNSHYNKCIELTDEAIGTSDNEQIIIWSEKENRFTVLKKILIYSYTLIMIYLYRPNRMKKH